MVAARRSLNGMGKSGRLPPSNEGIDLLALGAACGDNCLWGDCSTLRLPCGGLVMLRRAIFLGLGLAALAVVVGWSDEAWGQFSDTSRRSMGNLNPDPPRRSPGNFPPGHPNYYSEQRSPAPGSQGQSMGSTTIVVRIPTIRVGTIRRSRPTRYPSIRRTGEVTSTCRHQGIIILATTLLLSSGVSCAAVSVRVLS